MEPHAEQRPLLGPSDNSFAITEQGSPPAIKQDTLAQFLCIMIIFCFSIGSAVQLTPITQIYETIICSNYSHQGTNHSVPDKGCKAPSIQAELSNVQAWQSTLETIPGILVAVPYGALADRHSHKAVLQLSSMGVMFQIACQMAICKNLQHTRNQEDADHSRRLSLHLPTSLGMGNVGRHLPRWRRRSLCTHDIRHRD
jgi:hypothetical protein